MPKLTIKPVCSGEVSKTGRRSCKTVSSEDYVINSSGTQNRVRPWLQNVLKASGTINSNSIMTTEVFQVQGQGHAAPGPGVRESTPVYAVGSRSSSESAARIACAVRTQKALVHRPTRGTGRRESSTFSRVVCEGSEGCRGHSRAKELRAD